MKIMSPIGNTLESMQRNTVLKLYPETKVAEIQGDDTAIPTDLIPRCPHCGREAFPWVRGYGNFLTGKKYHEEYDKISKYILSHKDKKILFLELGVGRMTPMFIQEPFWYLTKTLPKANYISVNMEYALLITASNGLSIAEGYHIFADNEDFKSYFGTYREKYGIDCLIRGVFTPMFLTDKESYMHTVHKYLIDDYTPRETMKNLLNLVINKDYFVLTSNGDTHFQLCGFQQFLSKYKDKKLVLHHPKHGRSNKHLLTTEL